MLSTLLQQCHIFENVNFILSLDYNNEKRVKDDFKVNFSCNYLYLKVTLMASCNNTYGVFFSTKKNQLYLKKNAILCFFLKNISPSKKVVCFILNNLHFPMVEIIAFYALYKSRVLIIPCKSDDFFIFIGLPDEI